MHVVTKSVAFPFNRLLVVLCGALSASVAVAEETELPPVKVQAAAIAAPLGAVSVDPDFGAVAGSDSATLLGNVPGMHLNTAGGVSSLPAMHGLADDRLRIKLDGMGLVASCPNHMNPPLSYIDPSQIDSLLVYTGVTPVSVGGDSIGGSVIVETGRPQFAAAGQPAMRQGEAGVFYRSNNQHWGTTLAASYANEQVNLSYRGAWSRADNYHAADNFKASLASGRIGHGLSLDEVASTAFKTQNHSLGLAYRSGVDIFQLQLGYQHMPEQRFANQRMDLLKNEQRRVNLSWQRDTDWGELQARAYYERVDHFMDFGADKRFWYGMASMMPVAGTPCGPVSAMCAAGMPMVSESETLGLTLQADYPLTQTQLMSVGAEYIHYQLDDYWTPSGGGMWPQTFLNIHQGERDRLALFAELDQQLNARWATLLGARYERVSSDAAKVHGYKTLAPAGGNQLQDAAAFNAGDRQQRDNNIDLTAMAQYRHSDTLDMSVGFARKVRSPSLYERYTWSSWPMAATMNNTVGDGNGYLGDMTLQPETAHTLSATFDWHAADAGWQFKATPYYTRVSDFIDAQATTGWAADQFNVLQYANQSARIYGLDLSGEWSLAENRAGHWTLLGMLNYADGKNRETGDSLYNMMPLNGKLVLNQQHAGWNNQLELVMVDSKDQLSRVRNELATAGYGLLNLRFSHQWQRVQLDFGVENLLDKFYYQPTGGAYTAQGRTMAMNGIDYGVGVPGMGRALYAGMKVKF